MAHLSNIVLPSLIRNSRRFWAPGLPIYCIRNSSAQAAPLPQADDENKVYPEKIQNLVSEISKLTLLEVADLNDLLKKTLNIPDAPVMAMGMAPSAPASNEDEEEGATAKVQTSFVIKIMKFDDSKKVALIKHVKTVMDGMNLVQAKKFVESLPAIVRSDAPKDEAEKLKEELEAVGAECLIE